MYEYKFETVVVQETLALFGQATLPDYKARIEANAKEGWRLVQILVVQTTMDGRPIAYEAIFERALGA